MLIWPLRYWKVWNGRNQLSKSAVYRWVSGHLGKKSSKLHHFKFWSKIFAVDIKHINNYDFAKFTVLQWFIEYNFLPTIVLITQWCVLLVCMYCTKNHVFSILFVCLSVCFWLHPSIRYLEDDGSKHR